MLFFQERLGVQFNYIRTDEFFQKRTELRTDLNFREPEFFQEQIRFPGKFAFQNKYFVISSRWLLLFFKD